MPIWYRIRALDAQGVGSDERRDLTTRVVFTSPDPIAPFGATPILGVYVSELRAAVDAVRIAAGLGRAWTDYSPAASFVTASIFTQLRDRLNEARVQLLLPEIAFRDGTGTNHPPKLRERPARGGQMRRIFYIVSMLLGAVPLYGQQATSTSPPLKVAPHDGPYEWTHGPIQYDPAGNIVTIGTDTYVYDVLGRLVNASVSRPDQPGHQAQSYGYDVYGNRILHNGTGYPADATTNRLTTLGAQYDTAGNLTRWQPSGSAHLRQYTFDAVNMITKEVAGDRTLTHVYTADDERLWSMEITPAGQSISHWTVRDLGGKVLRDFLDDGTDGSADWALDREYVYRGGQLLAVNTASGTQHYSLDHLGTPRLVTDGNRRKIFHHHYLPFGEQWTVPADPVDASTLRFTGHERDDDLRGEPRGTLDYMHARFYSNNLGRFLSSDPVFGNPRVTQSFNRYAYALNLPTRYVDPDGREIRISLSFIYGDPAKLDDPANLAPFSWEAFWGDFFWFSSGLANSIGSNAFFGAGRTELAHDAYRFGHLVGDAASVAAGAAEMNAGLGGVAGGTILDLTGVGAAIGVPVQVVSGTLVVHGGTMIGIAGPHLMSGIKQKKFGKHGTFRGRDSKRANDEPFHRVAREFRLNKDQQQRLHDEIGGGDLSYEQIRDYARALFGSR